MSLHVSAVATKPQDATVSSGPNVIVRHTAQFPPCIWGDHFLTFDTNSMEMADKTKQQVDELKDKVRRMLMDAHRTSSQKLCLIDSVQRLGVSYHFETEINQALALNHEDWSSHDLHIVALKFRLLRQQGYRVSSDVFKKFMDNKGEFKESLVSDAQGMLGLYEATHLRVHGEDVLEQALVFTTTNLKSCLVSKLLSAPLAALVGHALEQPLHKGIPRFEHRYYIDTYQQDPSHNELLLTFAKLDFNIVQKLHLKELSELTRWWRDLDFKTKLPYARDRLVECYMWSVCVFFEPNYALGRRIITILISMVSFVDDTYDNYGTFEELEILTEAIRRWDIAALDELPEYMQIVYLTVLDIYREIEEDMVCEGKPYDAKYVKEEIKALSRAYFEESKWLNQDYTPTLEEYLRVTLVTSSYPLLIAGSFLAMGDFITKEALDWLVTCPKSVRGSCIVGRLMDDIVGHEFEQKRGHVASSVECYMKQHGVEELHANNELNKQVRDAWKDINEECLNPTPVPMPLLTRILNFTRVLDVVYKYRDDYTNSSHLKDLITAMFVDHVPI